MRNWRWGFVLLCYFAFLLLEIEALKFHRSEHTERISDKRWVFFVRDHAFNPSIALCHQFKAPDLVKNPSSVNILLKAPIPE